MEAAVDVAARRLDCRRIRIMGARVGVVTEADAVSAIVDGAGTSNGLWMLTANLDHLRCYHQEPQAKGLIEEADLIVADGTPLVWASLIAGTPLPERVTGSNLIWSICEEAGRQRVPVYLLGGNPGIADRAADVLVERYEDLEIAGTSCPPFGFEKDEEEMDRIEREVAEAAPGIVLLGLSFPKQDLLIRRLRNSLPHSSYVGVGASFNFVSGEVARAPTWTHDLGLEWAHRLWKEPRRLAKRYLVKGMPFAFRLLSSATWHRFLHHGTDSGWGWELEEGRSPGGVAGGVARLR